MIGEKFNSWTVIEESGHDRHNVKQYLCKCVCGNIRKLARYILIKGHSTRCKECYLKSRNTTQIGQSYGHWTVLEQKGQTKRGVLCYECKCTCGRIINVMGQSLRSGQSIMCKTCSSYKRGQRIKTHGLTGTTTYKIWTGIIQRCTNEKDTSFKDYGGRGIKVCNEWLKFENFLADMGIRPKGLQIDRINNEGNYEKGNCRWATSKENNNNTRRQKNKIYNTRKSNRFSETKIPQWERLRFSESTKECDLNIYKIPTWK